MDFWKETTDFEKVILASIDANNVLKLRVKSQVCASMIETAKYSMHSGRINRAWAFLFMAKKFWNTDIK